MLGFYTEADLTNTQTGGAVWYVAPCRAAGKNPVSEEEQRLCFAQGNGWGGGGEIRVTEPPSPQVLVNVNVNVCVTVFFNAKRQSHDRKGQAFVHVVHKLTLSTWNLHQVITHRLRRSLRSRLCGF